MGPKLNHLRHRAENYFHIDSLASITDIPAAIEHWRSRGFSEKSIAALVHVISNKQDFAKRSLPDANLKCPLSAKFRVQATESEKAA